MAKRDLRFWLVSIVGAAVLLLLVFAADDFAGGGVWGWIAARGVFVVVVLVWALVRWRRQRTAQDSG